MSRSEYKLNLNVSVSEPSGKTVEEREAAVRESGVAKKVADALTRRRRSIHITSAERDQIARMRELGLVPGLLDVIDRLETLSEERLEQLEACEVQRNAAEDRSEWLTNMQPTFDADAKALGRQQERDAVVDWLLAYSEQFNTEDDRTSALDAVLAARNDIAQGKHDWSRKGGG